MATKTITQLDAATALDHDDVFAVDEDGATKKVTNARLHNEAPLSTVAAAGATETLTITNGAVFDVTLDEACEFTFAGTTSGVACSFTLITRQDGSGGNAITWPASVDWAGGTAPTLSTAAGTDNVFTFLTVDNGTTWLGFVAGLDVK